MPDAAQVLWSIAGGLVTLVMLVAIAFWTWNEIAPPPATRRKAPHDAP